MNESMRNPTSAAKALSHISYNYVIKC